MTSVIIITVFVIETEKTQSTFKSNVILLTRVKVNPTNAFRVKRFTFRRQTNKGCIFGSNFFIILITNSQIVLYEFSYEC